MENGIVNLYTLFCAIGNVGCILKKVPENIDNELVNSFIASKDDQERDHYYRTMLENGVEFFNLSVLCRKYAQTGCIISGADKIKSGYNLMSDIVSACPVSWGKLEKEKFPTPQQVSDEHFISVIKKLRTKRLAKKHYDLASEMSCLVHFLSDERHIQVEKSKEIIDYINRFGGETQSIKYVVV